MLKTLGQMSGCFCVFSKQYLLTPLKKHCKTKRRHCERSEAIQRNIEFTGLLRRATPRNDDRCEEVLKTILTAFDLSCIINTYIFCHFTSKKETHA